MLSIAVAITLTSGIVRAETSISQGYSSDDELPRGAIVSITSNENKIEAATPRNASKILGIIGEQSLVELSSSSDQIQVAINGTTDVLVTDLNGSLRAGDKITASPLRGVGMKAVTSSYVVGTIQKDFSNAEDITTKEVTDKSGIKREVRVGMLPVQVNVSYYQAPDEKKSVLPEFMLSLARAIAGKDVSVLRIAVAMIILLTGISAIAMLLYSSVRSSIVSIGRNPLAAAAVNRSLLEVIFLSVGVLLVMLGAVYLILVM